MVQVLLFQLLLAFRCICLGSLAASAFAFAHAPQRPQTAACCKVEGLKKCHKIGFKLLTSTMQHEL